VALTGAAQIRGTIRELSLTGCLVATESSLDLGYQVRVEIEFRLHGNVFRINGITAGTRSNRSFGVRFLDLSDRRRQQLAGVVAEVEAGNLARAASVDS
jgi:c-di-GMP-binding flagellar brake protein YcgR